jgi:hypothetical protein
MNPTLLEKPDTPEAIPFDECHKIKCWEYGKQSDEEIADGRDTWWTEYWSPA